MDTFALQRALTTLGRDPGPIDGMLGARTRAALISFQRGAGLVADGIPGPKTVTALGQALIDSGKPPASNLLTDRPGPPWYQELLRRKGLHEIRDRSRLMAWLKSDGKTLGDPAKLPWCGDAIETCIALTLPGEPLPSNPYLARNWLKLGRALSQPSLGAVLVFWRGSRTGTAGHVGLYVGEDAGAYHVLGGNQSDAITIARLDKARLLGTRWPATWRGQPRAPIRLATNGSPLSTNEA